MRRKKLQPAAWLARVIAVGSVAAIVVLGLGIPGDRGRYRRAVRDQRTAVTHQAPLAEAPAARGERVLCARGATGFASAAAALYGRGLRDADQIVVPVALAAVSGAAIEADRWAEQGGGGGASPGPALPQRVGLDDAGATVAPPQAPCEGGPAFALARISGHGLPADVDRPTSAASSAASSKAKAKAGKKKPSKPDPKRPPAKPGRKTRSP